ncbi:hypothetical protein [Rhodoferax sp.]|uniref:hypothetical protein n=1 Tax=Rhodoferax sp. TaxID=50421 RepID=UPI0025CB9096|nr:hypothetical protein [Rhodoferax sp.]
MHKSTSTPRQDWCTASRSDASKSSGTDLLVLGEHLSACPQVHRHVMALHGVATAIDGFVATRFVTTLVVVALLFGFGYWAL